MDVEQSTQPGEYETHLTVTLPEGEQTADLCAWAQERGLKFTHIVLECGTNVSQPMLTKHAHGVFADVMRSADQIRNALTRDGFVVTRVKIEAAPWNAEVPKSVAEGLAPTPGRYFEHHIKLLLPPTANKEALVNVAQRYHAHLSRNARKQRADNYQERFVTQRCVGVGRGEAHQQLQQLLQHLTPFGYEILDVEEEFVVYDSNLQLDAGWIQTTV